MLLFFVLFDSKERKANDGKVYIAFIDSKAIFERFLKFGKKGDMRILEEKEPEEGIIRRIKRI